MSNNSPARRFLEALEKSLTKHNTLRGRPGDPHAPGDPRGYRSAIPPHKERGGHPGRLPSQQPHGFRGLDTQGSVQTLMILLRKAAHLFRDKSINDWNDMLEWTEEEVWDEGARVFGGADRVRELIDSLPERGAGENVNIDDVPENLIRQFYRGTEERTTPPKRSREKKPKKEPTPPKFTEESAKEFLESTDLEAEDVVRLLEQLEDENGKWYDPRLGRFVWDWALSEYNLANLTQEERERFFELSFEQKIAALEQMSRGVEFKDLDYAELAEGPSENPPASL